VQLAQVSQTRLTAVAKVYHQVLNGVTVEATLSDAKELEEMAQKVRRDYAKPTGAPRGQHRVLLEPRMVTRQVR
jgi:hypothetical protein